MKTFKNSKYYGMIRNQTQSRHMNKLAPGPVYYKTPEILAEFTSLDISDEGIVIGNLSAYQIDMPGSCYRT